MLNLPDGIDIDNLIENLRFVGWQASDILNHYSNKLDDHSNKDNFIKVKDNNEPVTLADLEVNNLILGYFKQNYKNIDWGVLSEENNKNTLRNETKKNWLWVLDPLDGTRDFIQGTNDFAMHLALNHENKPYLGIVLIPSRNELWISNGNKTWCENKEGIKIKPNLSNNKNLNQMTLVTSKNHLNKCLKSLISKIGFKEKLVMGSVGCKISSILRGEADIYISMSLPGKSAPKDWDFAAPEVILKNAGGAITNLENEELLYNKAGLRQEGIIIASNDKRNHKFICYEIKKIIKENKLLL